jgi:hypothetical protein
LCTTLKVTGFLDNGQSPDTQWLLELPVVICLEGEGEQGFAHNYFYNVWCIVVHRVDGAIGIHMTKMATWRGILMYRSNVKKVYYYYYYYYYYSRSITSTTGRGLTDTITCQVPILPSTSNSRHLALNIHKLAYVRSKYNYSWKPIHSN